MGTSTDGQISFGIAFEEGFEFPWDEDDQGLEDWWIYKILGLKHSKECYGEHGRLRGITEADVTAYFKEKRDFEAQHPLPVKLVNYCSGEYPMYILAVPSSCRRNSRGYAVEFNPANLAVPDQERAALLKFCSDHGIKVPSQPKWLLTSYWD